MTDPLTYLTAALDAAQRDAEAAGGDAWHLDDIVIRDMVDGKATEVDRVPDGVVVGADGRGVIAVQRLGRAAGHVLRHDPQATLRRIAADRKLIADLLAEKHQACEDSWYNCSAADEYGKRDGNEECDCGRDERVERRVRLIAEGYGWTETEQR